MRVYTVEFNNGAGYPKVVAQTPKSAVEYCLKQEGKTGEITKYSENTKMPSGVVVKVSLLGGKAESNNYYVITNIKPIVKDSIWREIRADYQDEDNLFIDAWKTGRGDEEGTVIAKIDTRTYKVEYLDERAKKDRYAQSVIKGTLVRLGKNNYNK